MSKMSRTTSQHQLHTQSTMYPIPSTNFQMPGTYQDRRPNPQIIANDTFHNQNSFQMNQINQIYPNHNFGHQTQPILQNQFRSNQPMPNFGGNVPAKINFNNRPL